jgi:thiamine-monophosphate kinase
MGAEPRALLLSLALPVDMRVDALDAVLDGFLRQADAHRAALVGGNITRTPGPLVINVTAIGTVRPRRVLTRGGARPGDELYVTGTVGDAATGLAMLRHTAGGTTAESVCVTRYLRPEARVRAGLQLSHHGAASSCVDLSDGLADGLRQLARASGVGVDVGIAALPISDESREWHAATGSDAVAAALGGGDDYELLFSAPRSARAEVQRAADSAKVAVSRIGSVQAEPGLRVHLPDGRVLPWVARGFDHFASPE